ncbi:hypothetical protein [Campylobacter rectus]|uniref:hypothetical protein n=1 Tax=Campylobacter rectus TaxID=203 RepID=UPI0028DC7ACD|nr:hypothetical protein [Campylobacter rectus]
MSDQISNKDLISKFKDYADIADASYAMLHWINENENDGWFDKFKDEPPARWKFADGITKGDTLKANIDDKDGNILRKEGELTAYSLAIEARFNQDMVIEKPKKKNEEKPKPIQINNEIQSFVDRYEDEAKTPYIFYNNISLRTKSFVNRYELLHHVKDTSITGYSSSAFYDSKFNNYAIGFRGTEMSIKDLLITDGMIAFFGAALDQIVSLKILKDEIYKSITDHRDKALKSVSADKNPYSSQTSNYDKDTIKLSNPYDATCHANYALIPPIVVAGHSLGGHLAQAYCSIYPSDVKELYTFNAPGFGGVWISLPVIAFRFLGFIAKVIYKGIRWVARILDPYGFIGSIVSGVFDKIKSFFGFGGDKKDETTLKECVHLVKENKTACEELNKQNVSTNMSKASKGDTLGIEVHHIDSVMHKIYDEYDEGYFDKQEEDKNTFGLDTVKRDANQVFEPSISVISDLGLRYGMANYTEKFDYQNTSKLHLINVLKASHFMKQLVEGLYLMEYLLNHKENEAKIKDKDIAGALNYLNDYIQTLASQILFYKIYLKNVPRLGNMEEEKISILESAIYPVSLYVNDFGYDDIGEAPNIEDPVSCLLAYKQDNLLIKIIDKEDIKDIKAKTVAAEVIQEDLNLMFAIYGCRFFTLDKKLNLEQAKDRLTYISDFYKDISSYIRSKKDSEELEKWIEARIEICKSAYELKFEGWRYLSNDKKRYLVFTKKSGSAYKKEIDEDQRTIVLPVIEALADMSKEDKEYQAKQVLKMIRFEPSELMHIYHKNCDIFLKSESVFDIKQIEEDINLSFKYLNTKVFMMSKLLTGGEEKVDHELCFKEGCDRDEKENQENASKISSALSPSSQNQADKDDKEDENSAMYLFQPRDTGSGIGRLNLLHKNAQAWLLNYDIKEDSLNIKLKPAGKKAKELKGLNQIAPEDKAFDETIVKTGVAYLHPVIEDDIITCEHGGRVVLKSVRGRTIKSSGIPLILGCDFINTPIVGCGIAKSPCTRVAFVPSGALSRKTINGDHALMQDFVNLCRSNRGSILTCVRKSNKLKISDPRGIGGSYISNLDKDSAHSNSPCIRLHFKNYASQKDNLPVNIYYLNDAKFENKEGFSQIRLNLSEGKNPSDDELDKKLKQNYNEDHKFKEFELRYGINTIKLVFVIPNSPQKACKQAYKDAGEPESGVGYFTRLDKYESLDKSQKRPVHTLVFFSPSYAKSIKLQIAKGFDKDNELSLDICEVVMLSGQV